MSFVHAPSATTLDSGNEAGVAYARRLPCADDDRWDHSRRTAEPDAALTDVRGSPHARTSRAVSPRADGSASGMLGEMVFTKGTTAQSAANMSDTDDRAWKQWKADTDARAVERYRALSSSGALAGDFPKGDAVADVDGGIAVSRRNDVNATDNGVKLVEEGYHHDMYERSPISKSRLGRPLQGDAQDTEKLVVKGLLSEDVLGSNMVGDSVGYSQRLPNENETHHTVHGGQGHPATQLKPVTYAQSPVKQAGSMLDEMVFSTGSKPSTAAQRAAGMSDADDKAWRQWKADTDARAVQRFQALSKVASYPEGDVTGSTDGGIAIERRNSQTEGNGVKLIPHDYHHDEQERSPISKSRPGKPLRDQQ